MGGYSSEHGISLKSGQAVFKALDAVLFEAYSVVQSKTGWSATNAQGTSIGFDPARMGILHRSEE
ncbi:MAG TPA: D-alanine--D-alanine ligase, partial [Cryomorphaceae bacterium]|nr:D-alanine--D-alanine ligase [Cryomorphaceae bacterium]